jgi:hypothetical protein
MRWSVLPLQPRVRGEAGRAYATASSFLRLTNRFTSAQVTNSRCAIFCSPRIAYFHESELQLHHLKYVLQRAPPSPAPSTPSGSSPTPLHARSGPCSDSAAR